MAMASSSLVVSRPSVCHLASARRLTHCRVFSGRARLSNTAAQRRQQLAIRAAERDETPANGSASESERSKASPVLGPTGVAALGAQGEFCIIEGPDALQDFARMQLTEIKDNITSRRNRIFLLLEEIRRLRIQQEIKSAEEEVLRLGLADEEEMPEYPSSIPFLPPITSDTLRQYYVMFGFLVAALIAFGGLVAPILKLKLGIGGTSYSDFISSLHLPQQLSDVDPIVASFTGGSVGVLSALLLVEVNNVKQHQHQTCMYCHGSGYLTCARCAGEGGVVDDASGDSSKSSSSIVSAAALIGASESDSAGMTLVASKGMAVAEKRCPNCAGSRKVMCPTCLCTGMALATEHDPRINLFE